MRLWGASERNASAKTMLRLHIPNQRLCPTRLLLPRTLPLPSGLIILIPIRWSLHPTLVRRGKVSIRALAATADARRDGGGRDTVMCLPACQANSGLTLSRAKQD